MSLAEIVSPEEMEVIYDEAQLENQVRDAAEVQGVVLQPEEIVALGGLVRGCRSEDGRIMDIRYGIVMASSPEFHRPTDREIALLSVWRVLKPRKEQQLEEQAAAA